LDGLLNFFFVFVGMVKSGGSREDVAVILRAAAAVGVDGVFIEVHPEPENAPVDTNLQWPLHELKPLLEEVVAIANASKGKKTLR